MYIKYMFMYVYIYIYMCVYIAIFQIIFGSQKLQCLTAVQLVKNSDQFSLSL